MSIQARTESKLIARLASVIFLLYFLFSVDRGNIGFAGQQMSAALGMNAAMFGLGSSLFTLSYLLFQVPNAIGLRRIGGGRAFAAIASAWGAISAATALVPSQRWFLVNRFLLGVAEAGFNAFVIYYINQVFPRSVRGFAVGIIFVAVPASMIIVSPLSGLLLNWRFYQLQGWQLMFIIEGLPSIVIGLLCLRLIPDGAARMNFLTIDERNWLDTELRTGEATLPVSTAQDLWSSFRSPTLWALGFVLFASVFAVNVMLVWMPQMIRQMSDAGNLGVGFLNAIPWLALGCGCLLMSRLSDKVRNRMAPLRSAFAIAALGFVLAGLLQDQHPVFGFAGLTMGAFGIGAAQGLFWVVVMEFVTGRSAAAAYAFIGVLGNGSGVFAHPLIGWLHDVTGSFAGAAWALAGFSAAAIGTIALLARTI